MNKLNPSGRCYKIIVKLGDESDYYYAKLYSIGI